MDLFGAQTFCVYKLTKVVVVCKDENLMFATFEVMLSGLKHLNDGQKLTIVSLVPSLSRNHLSGKIGHWILVNI